MNPCTCLSGCGDDCPGDDGSFSHCSGCAHRRRVTGEDLDKQEETLAMMEADLKSSYIGRHRA